MSVSLELHQLRKTYSNGHTGISEFSLDIRPGELIVLVGPSGCGKSTLLRTLAGLEELSGGRIVLDGEEVQHRSPAKRDIAMVFQNYALYPHMTVYQNMAYGLKNRKYSRSEIDTKVQQVADLLQLNDYLQRKPGQLSGGQRQRVAMGRAIVRNPKLFLFDEPLSNLDAKLRNHMRLEIRRLQKKLGVTSVYVTHDQTEAMTMGDRLVVLNQGRIEQAGTPMEIYQSPDSLFVAGFLGSPAMNLTEVTVNKGLIEADGIPLARTTAQPAYGKLILGVRPEHITLTAPQSGLLEASVSATEPLGNETVIHLCTASGMVFTTRVQGHSVLKPGDMTGLTFNTENIHLFNPETSLRQKDEVHALFTHFYYQNHQQPARNTSRDNGAGSCRSV